MDSFRIAAHMALSSCTHTAKLAEQQENVLLCYCIFYIYFVYFSYIIYFIIINYQDAHSRAVVAAPSARW